MKKTSLVSALLVAALTRFGAEAQAAALESYFDFTKYGPVAPGASIVSNMHGATPAVFKPMGATLNESGLTIDTEQSAANTGVLIPATALADYTADFTIQVWFITSLEVSPDTMICGGTTSASVDDSLAGDQALFLGYNHNRGKAEFLRPVVNNGGRWGATMDAAVGTGMKPLSVQDYVITYNSGRRVMTAYLNGLYVGTLNTPGFGGLAALTRGFSIGGVQNSAFRNDGTAPVNIRSFLIYSGMLSSEQIARVHAEGPSVGLDALRALDVVVK